MNEKMDLLFSAVDACKETILAAERHIWSHPEPGFREWNTHKYMKSQFEALGYAVTEAGNIPGFWTELDTGRPGPKLAIFAEMDSLIVPSHPEADPATGAAHTCGHHAQCAAMIGVAAALKADGALDGLSGSIRLIVVPAEELIEVDFRRQLQKDGIIRYLGGKQEFMYRGILDGVDLAMMLHTASTPGLACVNGSNGCITKSATFIGKGAHAGAAPHNGINALYAANCAMQAANALRETFQEADRIRFHPIITAGGDSVNAVPERVVVESYVRGASMEAISRENKKLNRAFAGAASAMGCRLILSDEHGYAPRLNDSGMQDAFEEVGKLLFPAEQLNFHNGWSGGCSDMGDVCCVMPAVHPQIGGASGAAHSSEFYITDPECACVTSAKVQAGTAALLLMNGAERAQKIVAAAKPYPSIREYLAMIDKNCFQGDAITYNDDGTVTLKYQN